MENWWVLCDTSNLLPFDDYPVRVLQNESKLNKLNERVVFDDFINWFSKEHPRITRFKAIRDSLFLNEEEPCLEW